ncbi:MAG: hypothetical protein JXA42_14030, partial [Anaerolineales bacterium]|nr:hypothetical protein [Anaerolineales bacterium]
ALEIVGTAQELAVKFDAMQTDDISVAVFRADLAVSQDDLASAESWAEHAGLSDQVEVIPPGGTGYSYYAAIQLFALARLRQAQGRFEQALSLLNLLHRSAESSGAISHVIKACALKALTFQGMGDSIQAMTSLAKALELAEPEGYVRIFDYGQPVVKLLRRALAGGIYPKYSAQLLAAFEPHSDQSDSSAPSSESLIEPLTDRERQVLNLLTTSLSTPEIAREMVVAPSTIRTHVRNIYNKLGVHNRIEAIHKARDLGLI